MYVVFLHGPPAAGKLTVGRHLSALTGLPLFHNHLAVDAALALFPFGSEGFRGLRESIWLAAFAAAADNGRSFIFTFAPEATVEPALLARLDQCIGQRGGQVLYVELRCSREAILARLAGASRLGSGKLTDPDLYRQIEAERGFEFPALPPPVLSIDTEATTPQAAAQAIAGVLPRVD